MAETGPRRNRSPWLAALIVAAIVGAVAALDYFTRRAQQPVARLPAVDDGDGAQAGNGRRAPPVLSREECLELVELKTRGLSLLENGKWIDADEALSKLAERLPDEPAAVRNLAIARYMQFKEALPEAKSASLKSTLAILERLKQVEPDSAITYRLLARFNRLRGESDFANGTSFKADAVRDLQRAAELDPKSPAIWNELFDAARYIQDPEVQGQALSWLKRAWERDPQNSYLALNLAAEEAQAGDADLSATVQALQPLIADMRPTLATPQAIEGVAYAADAEKAIAAGQPAEAQGLLFAARNVLVPEEWVQSDRRRVHEIHPLTFVVYDFQTGVCPPSELADASAVAPVPPIDVRFTRLADDRQPAALANARDINLSDFDLDGRADLIVLSDAGITVQWRQDAAQPWIALTETPLDGSLNGLLVADLDRDALPAGTGGTRVLDRTKAEPPPDDAASEDTAAEDTAAGGDAHPEVTCTQADADVIAFGPAGVQVLRNVLDEATQSRTLVMVEQEPELSALRDILAGLLVDLDADGDLDLVFSTPSGLSIWSNRGDMTFYDVTARSALPPEDVRPTSLLAVDWDRDLDLDVVLAGPTGPVGYQENLRHGATRWRPFEGKLADLGPAAGLGLLDVDANASWDLIGAGPRGVRLATTTTPHPGTVDPLATVEISPTPAERVLVWDFDNDSFQDLAVWGENGLNLLRADTAGGFAPFENAGGPWPGQVNATSAADLDGDGDLDLAVGGPEGVTLFDNEGGNQNHWIDVRVRGEEDNQLKTGRVNHYGLGSLLELRAGPIYRPFVVSGQVTHCGLGKLTKADAIRVLWTNGVPQVIFQPSADTEICEIHEVKGSCPFLYTWTGERFEFLTDVCWAAPIGLQHAEGVYAQPRAWEYLTVPGDRMRPRDGQYVIQLTEELWEATYFDQIELIAVDHPADVEIHSNEKVGPADVAEFKVHTVRAPRRPVAARDKHDRDILPTLARADGQFVRLFDAKLMQGLTDEHYLELDLGPLGDAKQITLFLTGWLRPTDTSLNVAISQNQKLPRPRPPALWTPDAAGEWREVRPFMGFPGGKTKTIAVDVSGLFNGDDHRLRIVTNMEFYWDEVFFTVDEQPAPLRLTHLAPSSADLHYRGFSAVVQHAGYGPDYFDHAKVDTQPKWPPMQGRYTRFGDVTQLITAEDDLLAVVAAGDEITVSFAIPAEDPPAGWKRDFLLHNVGWDKDADLNTIYGQSVEPLPFSAMSGYPYGGDESFPDTPRHRAYLEEFQTREQSTGLFWGRLRPPGAAN